MANEEKRPCSRCGGSGEITETHMEQDFAMGVALGAALGMGIFPSFHEVRAQVTCPQCHGRREV